MEQRLAPAERDHGGAQRGQQVEPPQHERQRHGLRHRVVLVAVGAGQVAAPDGDDVDQQRVAAIQEGPRDLARRARVRRDARRRSLRCFSVVLPSPGARFGSYSRWRARRSLLDACGPGTAIVRRFDDGRDVRVCGGTKAASWDSSRSWSSASRTTRSSSSSAAASWRTTSRPSARVIRRDLRLGQGLRTLDLGCGPGAFADVFAGDDYVGADLNARYIAHAQTQVPGHVRGGRRAQARPARPPSFDQVLIFGLLHHLSDDDARAVLSEVRAAARARRTPAGHRGHPRHLEAQPHRPPDPQRRERRAHPARPKTTGACTRKRRASSAKRSCRAGSATTTRPCS